MLNMIKFKNIVLLSAITLCFCTSAQAVNTTNPIQLNVETIDANMDMVVKDNFIKAKYASAENRFMQGNVKSAHDDFADIISRTAHDDYVFLSYGIKMAEYGFFNLSEDLFKKLDNNLYTENYIKDIRKFYYPSGMVEKKDLIYLSDAYSNIMYNNTAIETTSELINNPLVSENDYKNYLISLGFYKSNNLTQALKYINIAIMENDTNINYKILKAKILADSGKTNQAEKELKAIKKTKFLTTEFQNKIKSTEEYIQYKIAKEEPLKDYHLAYYYYLNNKSYLASKVLQSAILTSKQYGGDIFGLLAKIYYENDELLKAQEFAQRAYKENSRNYLANITLADIYYEDRNFESALEYYKRAANLSQEPDGDIGIIKSYLALEKENKAKKLCEKLLKRKNLHQNILLTSLRIFPQRADEYLSKIASKDVLNNDIWLALANVAIKDGNYSMAETYLNNSYYIDENNFKYYYYLSLVYQAKGDIAKSNMLLKKCSRLNSDYNAGILQD